MEGRRLREHEPQHLSHLTPRQTDAYTDRQMCHHGCSSHAPTDTPIRLQTTQWHSTHGHLYQESGQNQHREGRKWFQTMKESNTATKGNTGKTLPLPMGKASCTASIPAQTGDCKGCLYLLWTPKPKAPNSAQTVSPAAAGSTRWEKCCFGTQDLEPAP